MKDKVTTEEVKAILKKCHKNLRRLKRKTGVGTAKHRYISLMMNWIWFLNRITLADSKNLPFLDVSDIHKVKKHKVSLEGLVDKHDRPI